MPQARSKKSDSEWAEAFRSALCEKEKRPVGAGWKTTKQIRDELGCGHVQAQRFIAGMVTAKRAESFEGRVIGPSGEIVRARWYRMKKT